MLAWWSKKNSRRCGWYFRVQRTRYREKSWRGAVAATRVVHPFRKQPGASSVLRGLTQTAVLHLAWTRSRLNRPSIPLFHARVFPPRVSAEPRTSRHLTNPTALLFPTLRFSSLLSPPLFPPSSALRRSPLATDPGLGAISTNQPPTSYTLYSLARPLFTLSLP